MNIKGFNSRWVFLTINFVIVNLAILAFLGKDFPMLGHDYKLAIPQMLDTALHFRINGLSVQWYTPTFGGGIPAFPNPNNSQFSLLGILTIWVNPWMAVILSTVFYISIGFFATYRFFQYALRFNWTSSLLGALFFSANGFMFERIAEGHLGYQPFPLLAVLLILLLDDAIPPLFASLLFALTVSLLIHQAGYFLLVTFALSFLIIFPLIFIIRRDALAWNRIIPIVLVGGLVSALICASKLSAVYSFMHYFPRIIVDENRSNIFLAIMGVFYQILGTMNLVPISWMIGHDPNLLPNNMSGLTGLGYGYWEFDMSMSPIVFGILLAGVNILMHQRKRYKRTFISNQRWVAWLALIAAFWLCMEFILARGFVYPLLRHLPILGSLHVNNRFTAALLFPLAFMATHIYNRWTFTWSPQKAKQVLVLANLFTLLPIATYFTFTKDLQQRNYNIDPSFHIYQSILAGDDFEITEISKDGMENNTQVFLDHTSNLQLYEPIFGYGLESFFPEIKPGSVWDISNGYYNMSNPSGYVFPEINTSRPFGRIRVDEKERLEAFVNHLQPDWKQSVYQQIANTISTISLLLTLGIIGYISFKSVQRNWSLASLRQIKPQE